MSHKFNVHHRHKLDSEERRKLLPPPEILSKAGLRAGDIMADIGCGAGYFTLPAAAMAGPKGHIYALDIAEEMLREVAGKLAANSIANVTTLLTQENDLVLADEAVTLAFMSTVLHEVTDPARFLTETKRIMRPQGRISVLEWHKEAPNFGPPPEDRLDRRQVEQLFGAAGFKNIQAVDIGQHFYLVCGQK